MLIRIEVYDYQCLHSAHFGQYRAYKDTTREVTINVSHIIRIDGQTIYLGDGMYYRVPKSEIEKIMEAQDAKN